MATLKEVKSKIAGVKKTKQITSAMKMVATSKLRGAQDRMEQFRPYAEKFAEVLGSLAEKAGDEASPLLVPKEDVKKVHIALCTSDRGLCGGFNANLMSATEKFLKENFDGDVEVSYTNFGKKGRDWCLSNNDTVDDEYLGVVGGNFGFNVASGSGGKLINSFLNGVYDEVYVVYSEFKSVARQIPRVQQVLPIPAGVEEEDGVEAAQADESTPYLAEHICEPSPTELLGEMLPKNIYIQLYRALLETSTSEQAARMSAMDNATKACNDMIDELQTVYNKTRQAGITADLMDIVGGASALGA